MRCPSTNRRGVQCQRGAHTDGLHVYTGLALVGRKRKRERALLDSARAQAKARADGFCEAHGLLLAVAGFDLRLANDLRLEVCGTVLLHAGTNAHHTDPTDRARGTHDAARLLWLCDRAHPGFVHDNPERAQQLGLLRPAAVFS